MQRSQALPVTPGLHLHCPVTSSHCELKEAVPHSQGLQPSPDWNP